MGEKMIRQGKQPMGKQKASPLANQKKTKQNYKYEANWISIQNQKKNTKGNDLKNIFIKK